MICLLYCLCPVLWNEYIVLQKTKNTLPYMIAPITLISIQWPAPCLTKWAGPRATWLGPSSPSLRPPCWDSAGPSISKLLRVSRSKIRAAYVKPSPGSRWTDGCRYRKWPARSCRSYVGRSGRLPMAPKGLPDSLSGETSGWNWTNYFKRF